MGRDRIDLGMSALSVRGRARVQLFGPSGECVRDEIKDNFVSERWLRAMAWFANWGAFANNTATNSATTVMQSATAFRDIPFTGIALTDYDGAPDQNERLVRGKPLAHASKGVAGGGSARGSYNADESVHAFAYHKFVYDFGTSQANGIFQSIYTGYFNSSGNDDAPANTGGHFALTGTSRSASVQHVYAPSTGALYECTTSAIYEVIDWTPLAFGAAPVLEKKVDLSPNAQLGSFIAKDGRMFWLTAYASNARSIISAPLSDLSDTRVEKVLDYAWAQQYGATGGSTINSLTGFTYSRAHNKFFLGNGTAGAGYPQFGLISLDPATFADGDLWGAEGSPAYTSLAAYPGETSLIGNSRGSTSPRVRHLQLEDDGSITISHTAAPSLTPLYDREICFQSSSLSTSAATNQLFLAPAQHFFSRALLDEPVEKTSQNTMKITYEFTFDEPVLP